MLNKELESVKADKKLSEEELQRHRNMIAEHIRMQMGGIPKETIYSLSQPVRRKKPMKVKFSNFLHKIKVLIGVEHDIE